MNTSSFALALLFLASPAWSASTPSVPHSERAASLAAEVYSSLASSFFNLLSSNIAGFDAVFTVEKDDKVLSRMKVSWKRGEEKVSAALEGQAQARDRSAAEGLVADHVLSLLVWGPFKSALGPGAGAYAVKSGNQYVVDITEKSSKKHPEIESHFLFASEDFSRLRNLLRRRDGTLLDMTYLAEDAGGKQLVSTTSTTNRSRGKTSWTVDVAFTYTHTEGTVFVKRAVTKRTAGTRTTTWTAVLESVSFRKGVATPGSEKGPSAPEDTSAEGLRDRFLGEM